MQQKDSRGELINIWRRRGCFFTMAWKCICSSNQYNIIFRLSVW